MTMAGATGKLARKDSRSNMSAAAPDGAKEPRKLTRQGSAASLVSTGRTSLSGTLKLLTNHLTTLSSLDEDTKHRGAAREDTASSSGNTEGLKKGKKAKKKTTTTTKERVDDGKAAPSKRSENVGIPLSEKEVFTSLVIKTVQEALGTVYKDGVTEVSVQSVIPLLRGLDLDTSDESVLDLIRHSVIEHCGKINSLDLDSVIMKSLQLNNQLDVEASVVTAFKLIDEDEDGYITQPDIRHLMARLGERHLEDYVIDDMLEAVDIDQDGRISFKDFTYFLLGRYDLSYTLNDDRKTRRELGDSRASEQQTQTLSGDMVANPPSSGAKQSSNTGASAPNNEQHLTTRDDDRSSEKRRMFFSGNFVQRGSTTSSVMSELKTGPVDDSVDGESERSAETHLPTSEDASPDWQVNSKSEHGSQITTVISTDPSVQLNHDEAYSDLSEKEKHISEREKHTTEWEKHTTEWEKHTSETQILSDCAAGRDKAGPENSSCLSENVVFSRTCDSQSLNLNGVISKKGEAADRLSSQLEINTNSIHVNSRAENIGENDRQSKTLTMGTSENVSDIVSQVERLDLRFDTSNSCETNVGEVTGDNQANSAAPMSSPTMSTGIGTLSGTMADNQETSERLWEFQSDTITVIAHFPERRPRGRSSEDIRGGHASRHPDEVGVVTSDMQFAVAEHEDGEEELPAELRYQESDEGIDLAEELDHITVSKPDYVQRWLSAPVVSLPEGGDVPRMTHGGKSEAGSAWTSGDKFLSSRFGLAPDTSFSNSRSDLSDLHISLTSPRTDESSEEENASSYRVPKCIAPGGSRKPSTPIRDTLTPDLIAKSINDGRCEYGDTRRGRNFRRLRASLKSPTSKSHQNKVALSCQKIEVQEMELNSPVTADLFSNRKKFGSLPRDVSKFIVFGKSAGTENARMHNHHTKDWRHQTMRVGSPVRNKSASALRSVLKAHVMSEQSRERDDFKCGFAAMEQDQFRNSEDWEPRILYVKAQKATAPDADILHCSTLSSENRLLGRVRGLESRIMHRSNTVAGFQSLRDTNKNYFKARNSDNAINTALRCDTTKVTADNNHASPSGGQKKCCSVLDSLRIDTTSKKSCENNILSGERASSPREKHVCSKVGKSAGHTRMCYPSISRQLELTGKTNYITSGVSRDSPIIGTFSDTEELEENLPQPSHDTSRPADPLDSSARHLIGDARKVRPHSYNPSKRGSLLVKRTSSSAGQRAPFSGRGAGPGVTRSSIVTLSLPENVFYQRNMKSSHCPWSLL